MTKQSLALFSTYRKHSKLVKILFCLRYVKILKTAFAKHHFFQFSPLIST